MIKLREKDKQLITQLATQHLPNQAQLIAYGSRVNGQAHDTSDIDLVIYSPENNKLDLEDWSNLKEALQQSNLPILVDIFEWYHLPQSFRDNIQANPHQVLWQGEECGEKTS